MVPMTKACFPWGNQRAARIIQLRKQKAFPIPEMKWERAAMANELAPAKAKVPITQRARATRIVRRGEKRSISIPAGIRKMTSARR
jgi:hypothetical protein